MLYQTVLSIITLSLTVSSLPINTSENNQPSSYNLAEFREVHDQRQNGTENWQINLDGVYLLYAGPETLLHLAALLDPELFDAGDQLEDWEHLLNPQKPESTTGATTTTSTGSSSSTGSTGAVVTITESTTVGGAATRKSGQSMRRRLRLPGLLRPFLRRQQ